MMKNKKIRNVILFFTILILFQSILFAGESFKTGERLFKANKPAEAIPYLLQAMNEEPVEVNVFNYLGLAFYQTGQLIDSLNTFMKGTEVIGTNKKLLYYNAGNTAFSMADYDKAVELYSMALTADPTFASAVLNRANSKLKKDNLGDAVDDYTKYLGIFPETSQKQQIEALIAMLQLEISNRQAESERIAEEEKRVVAEQQRIAEEQRLAAEQKAIEDEKAKAEADAKMIEQEKLAAQVAAEAAKKEAERVAAETERRRMLLEEVASSLQDASTTNITAGSEGVMEYEQESELD